MNKCSNAQNRPPNLPKDAHFKLRMASKDPGKTEFLSEWKDNIWLFGDVEFFDHILNFMSFCSKSSFILRSILHMTDFSSVF